MYYVGICPLCEEGLLGIRVCGAQTMVLCDECDALWGHPPEQGDLPMLVQSDPNCPDCGESVWGEQAHWADESEVKSAGWWQDVGGEAGERDEPGGPRTPDRISPLVQNHGDASKPVDSDSSSNDCDSEQA